MIPQLFHLKSYSCPCKHVRLPLCLDKSYCYQKMSRHRHLRFVLMLVCKISWLNAIKDILSMNCVLKCISENIEQLKSCNVYNLSLHGIRYFLAYILGLLQPYLWSFHSTLPAVFCQFQKWCKKARRVGSWSKCKLASRFLIKGRGSWGYLEGHCGACPG